MQVSSQSECRAVRRLNYLQYSKNSKCQQTLLEMITRSRTTIIITVTEFLQGFLLKTVRIMSDVVLPLTFCYPLKVLISFCVFADLNTTTDQQYDALLMSNVVPMYPEFKSKCNIKCY